MRFLSHSQLPPEAKFSPSHQRRMVKDGKFPPPIALSARRRVWRESDIEAWLASRPIAMLPEEKAA